MRKIKSSRIIPKVSESDIIFFGIIAVCKKIVFDYLELLVKTSQFVIRDKEITDLIFSIGNDISYITDKSEKKSWTDPEVLRVKDRMETYFPVIEKTTLLRTRREIEEKGVYIQDYEFLTTLISTREFLLEEKEMTYLPEDIKKTLNTMIPNFSKLIEFFLKQIYFGDIPDKTKYVAEVVEMEVMIDDTGKLIKKTGYYSEYEIKDETSTKYSAGITKDGYLYVLSSDSSGWILNSQGIRLEWGTSERKKSETTSCIYRVGPYEIITNIRKNRFESLIKIINDAKIENIEIVKTLIEMVGYTVKR